LPPLTQTGTDLMKTAIGLSSYEHLTGLPYFHYGYGDFDDYQIMQTNPLKTAEASLRHQKDASLISSDTRGLYEFVEKTVSSTGFREENLKMSYKSGENIEDALEALFKVYETVEGLNEAKRLTAYIHDELKEPLAEYLYAAATALNANLVQNKKVNENAFRLVSKYDFCPPATSNFSSLQSAYNYHKTINEKAVIKVGVLMIKSSQRLTETIQRYKTLTKNDELLTIPTPAGNIILGTSGKDSYKNPEAFLLIDPMGDDEYKGTVGASISLTKPISVNIDLTGNDKYFTNYALGASQGSGLFGAGLLYDLEGDDSYTAYRLSQGFSFFGTGMLFDGKGNDTYKSELSSQAAGHYGLALNIDTDGNDKYTSYAYSQASSGNRHMSFLINLRGDDEYYVTPYPDHKYNNLYYSQYPKINGSWSQGCGMGQRNVSVPGERAVAGGYAVMVDIGGNDIYTGGIWTQGVGYWAGIGILCNVEGDDKYISHYYSQASVAHSGAGILTDIGGNDIHKVSHDTYNRDTAGDGASIGFVWDRGVALFVNDGGNDSYTAKQTSCGLAWSAYDDKGPLAQDNTYAFFIDTAGDDAYSEQISSIHHGYGRGGYFIDGGGNDTYFNEHTVNDRVLCDETYTQGGVFMDLDGSESGIVGFWEELKRDAFDGLE